MQDDREGGEGPKVCQCARRALNWIIDRHLDRLAATLAELGYELRGVHIDYGPVDADGADAAWARGPSPDETRH